MSSGQTNMYRRNAVPGREIRSLHGALQIILTFAGCIILGNVLAWGEFVLGVASVVIGTALLRPMTAARSRNGEKALPITVLAISSIAVLISFLISRYAPWIMVPEEIYLGSTHPLAQSGTTVIDQYAHNPYPFYLLHLLLGQVFGFGIGLKSGEKWKKAYFLVSVLLLIASAVIAFLFFLRKAPVNGFMG